MLALIKIYDERDIGLNSVLTVLAKTSLNEATPNVIRIREHDVILRLSASILSHNQSSVTLRTIRQDLNLD